MSERKAAERAIEGLMDELIAARREIEELKAERDELRQRHIEETNHLAAERDRVVRNAETAIRNVTTVGGQQRARITELEAALQEVLKVGLRGEAYERARNILNQEGGA